jgi:hypothetical protein
MRPPSTPRPIPHSLVVLAAHALDEAIAQLAARQFGVVARSQLVVLGLTSAAIGRRAARGSLRRVLPGIYAVGHEHLELRGRAMAALLWTGAGAVVSHRTAAVLWELLTEEEDAECHVTTTVRSGHQPKGIVVHRVRSLSPSLTSLRLGLQVTTVPRTLIDLAEVELDRRRVRRALGQALFDKRTTVEQLHHLIGESPGRRGVKVLRRLLPTAGATNSGLEDRFLPMLATAGIERPQVNVRVAGWRVDCHWPQQRVVVELDTWWSHGDHLSFEDDRRRTAALQRAGCAVVRITDEMLEDELNATLLTIAITLRDRT